MNTKCKTYCLWQRDSEAYNINAFTLDWLDDFLHAFPSFSLIPRVLKKIIEDNPKGILVLPFWASQALFPIFRQLLEIKPILLEPSQSLLSSPCK